jgi:hypothetical protein
MSSSASRSPKSPRGKAASPKSKSPKGTRKGRTRLTLQAHLAKAKAEGGILDVSGLAKGKAARKVKSPKGGLGTRRTRFGTRDVISSDEESFVLAMVELGSHDANRARELWRFEQAEFGRKLEEGRKSNATRRQVKRKEKAAYVKGTGGLANIRGYTPVTPTIVNPVVPSVVTVSPSATRVISPRTLALSSAARQQLI